MSDEADHVRRGLRFISVELGVPGRVGADVSALTANENEVDAPALPSETVRVTVLVPALVGLPEINPLDVLIDSPGGKLLAP